MTTYLLYALLIALAGILLRLAWPYLHSKDEQRLLEAATYNITDLTPPENS